MAIIVSVTSLVPVEMGPKKVHTILNYSHPLSEVAKQQLVQHFGEINELIIPVQIDFDSAIAPQLTALVQAGREALLTTAQANWPDFLVPPVLSCAAAMVGGYWLETGNQTNQRPYLIVLKPGKNVLRQFELAEII